MNFLDIAKRRFSVRTYNTRKIERDKLLSVLEAGRIAPTAANKQPQRILVIESKEGLEKLGKAANIFNAPCAMVVCADKKSVWIRPQDGKAMLDIDASIVIDHMMLQATDLGLGSVWIASFDVAVLKHELLIPDDYDPISILLLGYNSGKEASPDRHIQTRLPLNKTVSFETF